MENNEYSWQRIEQSISDRQANRRLENDKYRDEKKKKKTCFRGNVWENIMGTIRVNVRHEYYTSVNGNGSLHS